LTVLKQSSLKHARNSSHPLGFSRVCYHSDQRPNFASCQSLRLSAQSCQSLTIAQLAATRTLSVGHWSVFTTHVHCQFVHAKTNRASFVGLCVCLVHVLSLSAMCHARRQNWCLTASGCEWSASPGRRPH